jgi:hypothetical protein
MIKIVFHATLCLFDLNEYNRDHRVQYDPSLQSARKGRDLAAIILPAYKKLQLE